MQPRHLWRNSAHLCLQSLRPASEHKSQPHRYPMTAVMSPAPCRLGASSARAQKTPDKPTPVPLLLLLPLLSLPPPLPLPPQRRAQPPPSPPRPRSRPALPAIKRLASSARPSSTEGRGAGRLRWVGVMYVKFSIQRVNCFYSFVEILFKLFAEEDFPRSGITAPPSRHRRLTSARPTPHLLHQSRSFP